MRDLGTIRPGTTINQTVFDSFAASTGASASITGLAVTDIEIYKGTSMTQRSSDNGYTLLDTDGIDLDGIVGINGYSVNLADNSDAGFYSSGSFYFIVVSAITVDGQTVNFVHATFNIGYPDAVINTTIATLASQTSFTLTAGPAEDDALNGMWVVVHDVASAVQLSWAQILDYTGSTKTVTLAATPALTYTAAATDNISIMGVMPLQPTVTGRQPVVDAAGLVDANAVKVGPSGSGTAQTARDVGASVLLSSGTGAGQLSFTSGVVQSNLAQILGTALTETAGLIAAGFKKFFNIASPTSTMNQITLVDTTTVATTVTNLTNAPTNGDFTAAMKAATMARVTLVDTLTTYTGNTVQTGDSFARIGANGAGLTNIDLPNQTMDIVGNITGNLSGNVTGSVGSVVGIRIKKNTALAGFPFLMVLAADHVTPATGLTVVVQRSIDGGAFANATNTPASEISDGLYKIDLSAADLNGDTIALKMTSATADQRTIIIATEP